MKILSAEQMRQADVSTIKKQKIKSIDLMERAATLCYDWIYEWAPKLFPKTVSEEKDWLFHVVCGVGNNGGDGMVIARQLIRNGYNVEVSIVDFAKKHANDFKTNAEKVNKGKNTVHKISGRSDLIDFASDSVIIDAIFGTGLNRPIEGIAAQVIEKINASGAMVVSIDVPSGLYDKTAEDDKTRTVVSADHILTFQLPKLSFFLAENEPYVGNFHLLDIGLDHEFIDGAKAVHHLISPDEAAAMRRPRNSFSHKGTFGHALIIGGSDGKWGAPVITASACYRSGAGLVTAHVGSSGAAYMHNSMPELMISSDASKHFFTEMPKLDQYQAIGIGPGLGKSEETVRALKLLIQEAKVPIVFDADALNIISDNPTWLSFLSDESILTPHPGEFTRLCGTKLNHAASMEKQREMSRKYNIYILLKGANSSLALPDGRILINRTGNPGMATGGMGDALTGIITGLLASGYSSLEAAGLGMYLHGKAGDLALQYQSVESLLATDLIAQLGAAFNSLDYAD